MIRPYFARSIYLEILRLHAEQKSIARDPRVIDEHIDTAEGRNRLVKQLLRAVLIRDIRPDDKRADSVCFTDRSRLTGRVLTMRAVNNDIKAILCKPDGDCAADSPARTRHNGAPSFIFTHWFSSTL